jgi:hypothetical protein
MRLNLTDLASEFISGATVINPTIYDMLVEAAQYRDVVFYRPVALAAGIDVDHPHFGALVGRLLDEINRAEHAAGRPLLSAVVVGAETSRPGRGFFECANDLGRHTDDDDDAFWVAELKRVYDHWTPTHRQRGRIGE